MTLNYLINFIYVLCDIIIMYFLRWMIWQSNKIVVDSLSYQKKWDNRPTNVIHQSINSTHIIIYIYVHLTGVGDI